MAIKWTYKDVANVLEREQPKGLFDLWDAVPPGATTTIAALEAARVSNQVAITQGLTLLQQKVTAAAGLSVGFRPEIFERIEDLPGFDVLAETAELAFEGNLDLGTLTAQAYKLIVEIVGKVGELAGVDLAEAEYMGGVFLAVQVVWDVIKTIVDAERAWSAYQEALAQAAMECIAPAYSVELDQAEVKSAITLIGTSGNWQDLFFPEVRPLDPDLVARAKDWGVSLPQMDYAPGFTCCPTRDGNRVIAPVGSGIGNRSQRGWPPTFYGAGPGLGLLPMCGSLPIHRAIVGGVGDPALRALPQLAGLGQHVWRTMWSRGQAAFTVDGNTHADAWAEYFSIMRRQIGRNEIGIGGQPLYDLRACDDWSAAGRQSALSWLFERIGMPKAADPDGIVNWDDSIPCKAWRKYADYQTALLERVGIVYVDARTCHPKWRQRVAQAQVDLLTHPTAVCEVSVDDIPDPDYRQAVFDRKKQKGAQCFAVTGRVAAYSDVSATSGPSLIPLDESADPIPEIPKTEVAPGLAQLYRPGAKPSAAATVATVGAAGLGLWGLLRLIR